MATGDGVCLHARLIGGKGCREKLGPRLALAVAQIGGEALVLSMLAHELCGDKWSAA